jgi:hypothetical protein
MRDAGLILMIVSAIVLVARLAYLQGIGASSRKADLE